VKHGRETQATRLAELASEFGVHRTMISAWKQERVKNAKTLFERGNKKMEDPQKLIDHLHRKIGQLQVERDLVPA
jgi:transposase